jgi:hypothetical protein
LNGVQEQQHINCMDCAKIPIRWRWWLPCLSWKLVTFNCGNFSIMATFNFSNFQFWQLKFW